MPRQRCLTFLCSTPIPYRVAWRAQQLLHRNQVSGLDQRQLLLACQHPLIYTAGRRAAKQLTAIHDRDSVVVERGGQVTCHAPGQLVFYPLLDLTRFKKDLRWYVNTLEEIVINVLAQHGMSAGRHAHYPGVWLGKDKIAAIGISCSRWKTMHGFSLNADTDLTAFDGILPCGIGGDHGVTSITEYTRRPVDCGLVQQQVINEFQTLLNVHCDIRTLDLDSVMYPEDSEIENAFQTYRLLWHQIKESCALV